MPQKYTDPDSGITLDVTQIGTALDSVNAFDVLLGGQNSLQYELRNHARNERYHHGSWSFAFCDLHLYIDETQTSSLARQNLRLTYGLLEKTINGLAGFFNDIAHYQYYSLSFDILVPYGPGGPRVPAKVARGSLSPNGPWS